MWGLCDVVLLLCIIAVNDDLINESAALNEEDDDKDKERSLGRTDRNNTNVYTRARAIVSFDAQPVNFYLRIGTLGSFVRFCLILTLYTQSTWPEPLCFGCCYSTSLIDACAWIDCATCSLLTTTCDD